MTENQEPLYVAAVTIDGQEIQLLQGDVIALRSWGVTHTIMSGVAQTGEERAKGLIQLLAERWVAAGGTFPIMWEDVMERQPVEA